MPGWSQNPFWLDDADELEQEGLSSVQSSTPSEKKKPPISKKKTEGAPKKRKAGGSSSGPKGKTPKPSTSTSIDLFGSETEAEEEIPSGQSDSHEIQYAVLKPMRAASLRSFLSQRGSNGYTTQRDPVRAGEFYIELRVYNAKEAEREPNDERWKKALVTLKTCTDSDSPIWKSLSTLVKAAKDDFKSIQPIMYPVNDQ